MAQASVMELKAALSAKGVNFAGCVEKADLLALWLRATGGARAESLPESGGSSSPFLEHAAQRKGAPATAAAAAARSNSAATGAARPVSEPPAALNPREAREQEARREVGRILGLHAEAYPNVVAWAYAVLGISRREAATSRGAVVNRAYRSMMKQLHPDKVEQSPMVDKAIEVVREAREAVERSLLRQQPPLQPRALRATTLCSTVGQRRVKLLWKPPTELPDAPVTRYTVAIVDPAYGRPLAVATLEPDYSQELGRFLPIEELTNFVLAEEELLKMPRFWQQSNGTVQVAAGNDAGHSSWSVLQVPLGG